MGVFVYEKGLTVHFRIAMFLKNNKAPGYFIK
jgi:hypothetical protein